MQQEEGAAERTVIASDTLFASSIGFTFRSSNCTDFAASSTHLFSRNGGCASIYSIADRVIMLDKRVKKIVADGDPRDLRDNSDNPWVKQFFHREASAAKEREAS